MGLYTFSYIPDTKEQPTISVQFDDHNGEFPFIEHVVSAFEQFLLGMTFQPSTISKYLHTEGAQRALLERAELVRDFKNAQAANDASAKKPAKAKTKKGVEFTDADYEFFGDGDIERGKRNVEAALQRSA